MNGLHYSRLSRLSLSRTLNSHRTRASTPDVRRWTLHPERDWELEARTWRDPDPLFSAHKCQNHNQERSTPLLSTILPSPCTSPISHYKYPLPPSLTLTPRPRINTPPLQLGLRLRVARSEVPERARPEHPSRIEGDEDRDGQELGRGVQHVERGLVARGVLRPWGGREKGRRGATEDCYTVDAHDGLECRKRGAGGKGGMRAR